MALRESMTWEKPAIPVAKVRRTSVSSVFQTSVSPFRVYSAKLSVFTIFFRVDLSSTPVGADVLRQRFAAEGASAVAQADQRVDGQIKGTVHGYPSCDNLYLRQAQFIL